MERSNDSVTTLGVTRNGFMQLQAMMIQQQRLDICWTVLRSFGYNRQLHLKPEMFAHIKDLATEPVRPPTPLHIYSTSSAHVLSLAKSNLCSRVETSKRTRISSVAYLSDAFGTLAQLKSEFNTFM